MSASSDIGTKSGSNSIEYTPKGTNSGGAVQGHAITVAEMPKHRHPAGDTDDINFHSNNSGLVDRWEGNLGGGGLIFGWLNSPRLNTGYTGGNQAHSHEFTQPTFTGTKETFDITNQNIKVYMWKRVS